MRNHKQQNHLGMKIAAAASLLVAGIIIKGVAPELYRYFKIRRM